MHPKVSIIIPVYKTEQYLRKCLDSIVNQTLKDIEIICVNDGSPDNSQAILAEYASKDKRIVILNQANEGVSSARNAGLSAAKGQYIGFVDSDDWIDPETYATAVQYMTDDVDLVCWGVNVIGDTKEKAKMLKFFNRDLLGKNSANFLLKVSLPTTIWDKLFRKSIVKNHDINFPKHIRYEDTWFLWKYLLHVNNFYSIERKFYNYILHENSFMASEYTPKNIRHFNDRLYGLYDVYLHYDKFNATLEYSEFLAKRFYRYFRTIFAYTADENKKDFLELASNLAQEMDLNGSKYHRQLFFLKSGKFDKLKIVIKEEPLFIKRLWMQFKASLILKTA